ncbi:MAG: hypothetical protein ACI31V_05140 [Bacilli bacterium]
MNNVMKFLNYNWIKIIKQNIKNNNTKKINSKEKNDLIDLIFKKEICALVFIILNFLITYTSSIEIYKSYYRNRLLFHGIKEIFPTSFIWFIILTILPLLTCIMLKKKIKSKHYLLLILLYNLSNLYNIIMIVYFITTFINNILFGVLGIINIVITVLINISIIIKLKENYLK